MNFHGLSLNLRLTAHREKENTSDGFTKKRRTDDSYKMQPHRVEKFMKYDKQCQLKFLLSITKNEHYQKSTNLLQNCSTTLQSSVERNLICYSVILCKLLIPKRNAGTNKTCNFQKNVIRVGTRKMRSTIEENKSNFERIPLHFFYLQNFVQF